MSAPGRSAPGGSAPGGVSAPGGCLLLRVSAPGGVCLGGVGGGVPGGAPSPSPDGYCCRRYASYWNAFLFVFFLKGSERPENS